MNRLLKRTSIFIFCGIFTTTISAQKEEVPKNWYLLDQKTSGFYGISIDKAYEFVNSKKLKSKPVVVAVIDSGIDTVHEDLLPVLWTNTAEIPGNGVDDDKNGYVDDIHGWNFLGGKDGSNVKDDTYEAARVYHRYKTKYAGKAINEKELSTDELFEYKMWKRSDEEIFGVDKDLVTGYELLGMQRTSANLVNSDSILKKAMKKEVFTGNELKNYNPVEPDLKKAKRALLELMELNNMLDLTTKEFAEGFKEYVEEKIKEVEKKEAGKKEPKKYREEIVKDDYNDPRDKFYGNNDIMASTALHGTHVSGIIGAIRKNGKGVDGIADNVKIMTVRTLSDGDEHDKDVAMAIRYAVDNGAAIVNMSFGKAYSPEKKWVDDAVRYAESKGVLLVQAAGNDANNIDTFPNYPSPVYFPDKRKAANWITVGASGDPKLGGLTAPFSNYGKNEVDVFAPGVKIYSSVPGGNTYNNLNGTSMASPVVAGIAAFILNYYPTLSAKQVKYVIEKSARVPDIKVNKPGTEETVNLSEISKSGGLVNAFEAIKLAATLKGEKIQKPQPVITKSTVKQKAKG